MATRQAIRQATIDALAANTTVAALVGARVYADPHSPYPAASPYPVLFVGTPTTDSDRDSDDETVWASVETLSIVGLCTRTAVQSDSDLETAGDVLELAVLNALLPNMTWRDTCDFDEIRRIRRQREKGTIEGGAHYLQVTIGVEFVRRETFAAADSETLLEWIELNLHRIDDTTGAVPVTPTVSTDIDCRT